MQRIIKNRAAKPFSRSTWVFAACFVLAGVFHVLDKYLNAILVFEKTSERSAALAFGSTVFFVLNLAVYVFMVLLWITSLQTRLLPSKGRRYLISAAVGMLFFLLMRVIKYRLVQHGTLLEHWCWYIFYIPVLLIPTLFLFTCISMYSAGTANQRLKRIAMIFSACLLTAVFTNDIHHLMFRPYYEGLFQNGAWGTYTIGPLWYVLYGYIFFCILFGFVLLARIDRGRDKGKRVLPPLLMLLAALGIMLIAESFLNRNYFPSPWAFPEAVVIIAISVFESCIRSRLIPYNENYVDFFKNLHFPTVITNTDFHPVYCSDLPIDASAQQLKTSLVSPLEIQKDILLYGRNLKNGNVFWTSNETVIRELNDELTDISESLSAENDLLVYENRQRETRARIDARNSVYVRAAQEVYPTQKRIAALIENTTPDSFDFAKNISEILFLNAYVKRKTNFLLMSLEHDTVSSADLYLALDESARFLTLCGVNASVVKNTNVTFSYSQAVLLYDSFEVIAESLLYNARNLLVTLCGDSLRFVADCEKFVPSSAIPAECSITCEDRQIFICVTAGRGTQL